MTTPVNEPNRPEDHPDNTSVLPIPNDTTALPTPDNDTSILLTPGNDTNVLSAPRDDTSILPTPGNDTSVLPTPGDDEPDRPSEAEFTTPAQLGVLSLDEPPADYTTPATPAISPTPDATATRTTPAATRVLTDDDPRPARVATAPAEPETPGAALPPSLISTGPRRPLRMRTVVLGLVLLVIAGAVMVSELTEVSVDGGAVVLALMIGAGALLIAGARRT